MPSGVAQLPLPKLVRSEADGVVAWTDRALEPLGVTVGFSERSGGVSVAPYSSLNVAGHVGDDPSAVSENRRRLLAALGLDRETSIVVPRQVHGVDIVDVALRDPLEGFEADGLFSIGSGPLLLLCFADCVPVVLAGPGPSVAVLHAGWRGVIGGIAGDGVRRVVERTGGPPDSINVYIGPHIGIDSFQVDPALAARFSSSFGERSVVEAATEKPRVDLAEAVRTDLARAGVDPERIAALSVDTAGGVDRFFSYRAEGGRTGRHGAFAHVTRLAKI